MRVSNDDRLEVLVYYLLLGSLMVGVGAVLWAYSQGEDLAIGWSKKGLFEVMTIPFDNFEQDLFDFSIPSQTYIFVEQYISNPLKVSGFAHIGQLVALGLSIIILSACLSEFKKIAYLLGLGFLFFVFSNLNLESLGLLTYDHLRYLFPNISLPYFDKTLAFLIILLYGLTTYYFKVLAPAVSFRIRLLVFTAYTVGIAVFIASYVPYTNAQLFLNSYGTFIPLVGLLIVSLVCGYEIVRVFVNLITVYNERGAGRNIWHLIVIFLIYFANLFLLYLVEIKHRNLGLYYLPYSLVASTSLVLGIGGLKAIAHHYRQFIGFKVARLTYLSLAILGLSGLFTAYATANDLLIQIYKEIIIYSHMALSFGFMIYILGNFYHELWHNSRIKHIFRPQVMGVSLIWVIGLMAVLVYSIFNNKTLFVQQKVWGAYFNTLGFAHYHNGESLLAKQYYNLALQYIPANHHASYALGMLARAEQDDYSAQYFFGRTEFSHPSPYNSIQIAALLEDREAYFKALFALQKAAQKFKYHPQINNNLALLYNKINISDSVFSHFSRAEQFSNDPTIPANTFALWVKYDSFNNDVSEFYRANKSVNVTANRLAYMNNYRQYDDATNFLLDVQKDTILDAAAFCYLYNYIHNHLANLPPAIYDFVVKLSRIYANRVYTEYLTYALALLHYKRQDFRAAFSYLERAADYAGQNNTYYPNLLGLWYLKFGEYQKASRYFRQALQLGYAPARFNLAFSLTKLNQNEAALKYWRQLERENNSAYQVFARRMVDIFERFEVTEVEQSDDFLKYHYLLYKNTDVEDPVWQQVFKSIELPDLKAKVLLEQIRSDKTNLSQSKVAALLEEIATYELSPKTRYEVTVTELLRALESEFLPPDFDELVASLEFKNGSDTESGWLSYFKAIQARQRNNYAEAVVLFKKSIQILPFEARPYQSLANLYKRLGDQNAAYDLILEGLKFDPKNEILLITYFRKCLELNYLNFAKDALETLSEQVSKQAYEKYLEEYKEVETAEEDF